MRTAHLADDKRPSLTACGEPWEGWQHPDRGASLAEALAVPGLTQTEKAEIRAVARSRSDKVRQCQVCLKVAMTPGNGSAAVPSEPRRWTIYRDRFAGRYGSWYVASDAWNPVTDETREAVTVVEEVGPVSEAQVEAGARGLHARDVSDPESDPAADEWDHLTLHFQEQYCADARAVLSAAREVKSDG